MSQLYAIRGKLKPNPAVDPAGEAQWNEHLAQDGLKLYGRLFDEHGKVSGVVGILEADNLEMANRFLSESPRHQAYETTSIDLVELEVGHV